MMTAYTIAVMVCGAQACVIVWLGWLIMDLRDKRRIERETLSRELLAQSRTTSHVIEEYQRLLRRTIAKPEHQYYLASTPPNQN